MHFNKVDKNLPNNVFGYLRKNDYGPATELQRNNRVCTPARNIIRVGLPCLTFQEEKGQEE